MIYDETEIRYGDFDEVRELLSSFYKGTPTRRDIHHILLRLFAEIGRLQERVYELEEK